LGRYLHQLNILLILCLASCQLSSSNKLKWADYDLINQSEYHYSYNLLGLKDTTLSENSVYFNGQLAFSNRSITISKYDTSNKLILEQEFERENNELKLIGEKHLIYNQKHQLIKDIQINDGQMFMSITSEYNDFDSISKVITLIKHSAPTLEEAAKEDRKKVKYDTTIVRYTYNDKRQRISPEYFVNKPPETIKLNDSERIEIKNDLKEGFTDSTWIKGNLKVKTSSIFRYPGKLSKTIFYFNSKGDVTKSLTYEKSN
jgi:hypothetical protein